MLQLNNITKRFQDGERERTVLDGLSLTVDDGAFIAITGESGAGKTTLLSIMATLLDADAGVYTIDGTPVASMDLSQVRNKQIGIVFQDHRLLPQFTAVQNVLLPVLAQQAECPKATYERALQLMEWMGIRALEKTPVGVLSGGEKTRVAICRALINNPKVLLADEPTGQLDSDNAHTIASLFQKVNSELHTTIVMVTHSDAMASVAHKVYRLENGKLEVRG
ncbi:MAG: ABC transporter ATP-binding protein [Bacteroidaceae bacterium]|nr:ABC transporter ATP-binding protein [Bacteroidaceae bacterium]